MGLFKNQLANVVEWEEYRDDVIFTNGITVKLKRIPFNYSSGTGCYFFI